MAGALSAFRIHFHDRSTMDVTVGNHLIAEARAIRRHPTRAIKRIEHLYDVEEAEKCPICAEVFASDDICAADIEMGTCHAACLEGSPVVDLETGEPVEGVADTFRYEPFPTSSSNRNGDCQ